MFEDSVRRKFPSPDFMANRFRQWSGPSPRVLASNILIKDGLFFLGGFAEYLVLLTQIFRCIFAYRRKRRLVRNRYIHQA
jgi:hypothetical protein